MKPWSRSHSLPQKKPMSKAELVPSVGVRYEPLGYLSTFHADRYEYTNRAIITGYGGGKTYAVCMERKQALNGFDPTVYEDANA